MNYQKPEASQLLSMMGMVITGEVKAKAEPATQLDVLSHTAIYVNNDDEIVATCSCALPTAAALGCSLSMIPVGGAEGMVEDKELSDMANDNFYEVMNMFSSLLMNDKTAHLKLKSIEAGDERVQGDGCEEASFSVVLGNYGAGELVFSYT